MPVYTVIYEGQLTSRHPHIPPSDQRIFDQQVPSTRTITKCDGMQRFHMHRRSQTGGHLAFCNAMFTCLIRLYVCSYEVSLYTGLCTHTQLSPLNRPWLELWCQQTSDVCNPERPGIKAGQSGLCTHLVAWQTVQSKFFQVNLYNRTTSHAVMHGNLFFFFFFPAIPCFMHSHPAASCCI